MRESAIGGRGKKRRGRRGTRRLDVDGVHAPLFRVLLEDVSRGWTVFETSVSTRYDYDSTWCSRNERVRRSLHHGYAEWRGGVCATREENNTRAHAGRMQRYRTQRALKMG